MPRLAFLFRKMILMGEELKRDTSKETVALVPGRKAEGVNQGGHSGPGWIPTQESWPAAEQTDVGRESKEGEEEALDSGLGCWEDGVPFTEIGKTEGRTDFAGEDDGLRFGRVEFEMPTGTPTIAV